MVSMPEAMRQRWLFEHTHLKTSWIQHQVSRKDAILTYPPPPFVVRESSSSSAPSGTRISPAVLFIIVILAVLFFISGLLHLLVRFLIKKPSSSASSQSNQYPDVSTSEALQRQLQQLFNLHDSGLDQAFIDALPVFVYREIVGAVKEPFDCAVCLSEFSEKDQLRLLPTCSHAFHLSCIDTWLLSNSTCPLCRNALFNPGLSMENPIYDYDDDPREDDGCSGVAENVAPTRRKTVEIEEVGSEKGIFPVRLGKFRRLDGGGGEVGGETSSSRLDARRCYSMGSYQYVVNDAHLRVAFNDDRQEMSLLKGGGREQGNNQPVVNEDREGKKIGIGAKTDSYSVSKIWLWPRKGKFASSSETQTEDISSFDTDLPWMRKPEGRL